jgi:uncharacterized caspase-like protein
MLHNDQALSVKMQMVKYLRPQVKQLLEKQNQEMYLLHSVNARILYQTIINLVRTALPSLINDGINASNGRILTSRFNYNENK